jgi:hypothetical protein
MRHFNSNNTFLQSAALAIMILALLTVTPCGLQAQSVVGRISGTVTDSTGAIIPGAQITITNEATKADRSLTTDSNGFYIATALPVGVYTISVEMSGFKKAARSGNNMVADGRLTADFKLEVGQINQTVEVTAATGEVVNTVSGEVQRVVDTQQVQDLALNARNYMQLTTLIPGSVLLDEDQLGLTTSLSITAQTVNGNRGNTNYLSVDGGSNMDSGSNGSQINNVGIDFIREVNIKSSNFSAEFGRNSGASINIVTRSGEDRFHGGLLEFFRNDKLDARNFFAPVKGPLRFNDYGYNLGGPLKRGRIWFFVGEEWKTIRKVTDPTRQTIPTRAERAGDFSLRSGNLNLPGTTTPVPGRNIANLMSADGKAIAAAYTAMEKLAVSYVDTPTANNVIHQMSNPFNWRQDIARLDFKLNEKQSMYYRYMHDMYDLIEPYGTFSSSNLPTTPTNRLRPGYSNQVAHTWLISPIMTNEAKLNASWNGQRIPMVGDAWRRSSYGFQYPTIFGATSWNGNGGIPNISISNFANLYGPNFVLISPTTDIQMMDNFTIIKGKHMLKVGFTGIRNRKDQNGRSNWLGAVSFSTSGNTKTTGNAFADSLIGNFRNYTETSADPIGHFRFTSYEGYISDSWKFNRKLSLEYGVRWQRNLPTYVSANNITNFDPSLYDPSKAVTVAQNGTIVANSGNRFNGLIVAGDGVPSDQTGRVSGVDAVAAAAIPKGAPRGMYDAQLLWAPRFSFAYAPNLKTSIRGGVGIFYDKPEGNIIFSQLNIAPWLQNVSLDNGNLGNPSGGTAAALTPFGAISAINPKLKTPSTMNASFGIQRELPWGTFLEVTYVTNEGYHLIRQPDINQIPFVVYVWSRTLPTAQRPADNALRPYKGYSNINMRLSDSNSNYHSMQVYLNKRKGRFTYTVSYTLAKVLTDTSGNGDNPEGYLDRHYNYGPASFDRHHAFVTTYSYQVPFLKGGSSFASNPVVKGIFSGWQLSGITRFQTGAPLTVTANTSTTNRRADYLGGSVLLGNPGPNGWLNPAAFAAAPDDRRGNSSVGIARGPGLYLWDFSIRKNFSMSALREGMRLQFQADMFNAWNWANFKNPQANMSNASFNTVGTAGPPRNIQFALKLNF